MRVVIIALAKANTRTTAMPIVVIRYNIVSLTSRWIRLLGDYPKSLSLVMGDAFASLNLTYNNYIL